MNARELAIKFMTVFGKSGDGDKQTVAAFREMEKAAGQLDEKLSRGAPAAREYDGAVSSLTRSIEEMAATAQKATPAADSYLRSLGRDSSQVKGLAEAVQQSALARSAADRQAAKRQSEEQQAAADIAAIKTKVADNADSNTWRTMTVESKATAGELEKASRAAWAMKMAANGSTEGFRSLANMAMSLGNTLGSLTAKVTMVGAAFMAGWQVGDMIRRKLIDPILEAKSALEGMDKAALDSAKHYRELNSTSMAKLVESLSGVEAKAADIIGAIERVYQRQKALEMAQSNTKVAEMMASMPDSPERDKAVAEEQRRLQVESAKQTKVEQQSIIDQNKKALDDADEKLAQVVDAKRVAQAKAMAAASSGRSFGGAEATEYRQAMEEVDKKIEEATQRREEIRQRLGESQVEAANKSDIADQQIAQANAAFQQVAKRADEQIRQRGLETTVPVPENDEVIRRGRLESAYRGASGLVQPMSREDGMLTPRNGRETQEEARRAIADAAERIYGGEGEAQVYIDLAAKLKEMGAVVSGGYKKLSEFVDQMDGEIGNLRTEVANLKQRERVAQGVN